MEETITELILESEDGVVRLGKNTLVIAIDDTGNEDFKDPNHPVFGLGGCGFLVKDYQRLVEVPWNYMCTRFFPKEVRPLHAANIHYSLEQMEALNHFFTNFEFFRIATTASHKTVKEIDEEFIQVVGGSLLERICDITKWVPFDRLIIIFECSERIELKVLASLSGKEIVSRDKEIEIELAVLPKSACMPALEVADFIIHTAGAQTRERNKGNGQVRKDFENIFRNVDSRLTSFMEITNIKYNL